MTPSRERTPVDQHLHVARQALERGDLAEARGHLRRVMSMLALHSNEVYIRAKVKEVRRIESAISTKGRSQLGSGFNKPASPASRNSPAPRLTKRASRVDYLLRQGQVREARELLQELRVEVDTLDDSCPGTRALRTTVRDLLDRVSKFEAARKSGTTTEKKPKPAAKNTSAKAISRAPKKSQPVQYFVCDRCKRRRPTDQAVSKRAKDRVCIPCATGQVCPSCHRSKSPDFELCIRCSGGGGKVRIVYAGAFESNRARH